MLTRTTEEWEAFFDERREEIMYQRVFDYEDVMADPQALENGYIVEKDVPGVGKRQMAGQFVQFSETPASAKPWFSQLGQHTAEVMAELGFGRGGDRGGGGAAESETADVASGAGAAAVGAVAGGVATGPSALRASGDGMGSHKEPVSEVGFARREERTRVVRPRRRGWVGGARCRGESGTVSKSG